MRAIVVGATGTIGSAVAEAFSAAGDEVLKASRSGELPVDISKPGSIHEMYSRSGTVDAVVCCAGSGAFAALGELTDEQIQKTIASKLMGQVNLVRFGVSHLSDGGVFILTSGIFSQRPIPGVPALALANGAVESFTRGAALDLPRNQRIGTIAPPVITETARKAGISSEGSISAAENAKWYVAFAEGTESGTVLFPEPSGSAG